MGKFITEIGMRDVDQALRSGGDISPTKIGDAIFGNNILQIVTQRSDGATGSQRGNNLRNVTLFGMSNTGNRNKTASIFGILYATYKVELTAACRVLARTNAFCANLPSKINAYCGVYRNQVVVLCNVNRIADGFV